MKKQTKKQTKNQKKYADLAAGAMLAGAALMNPKRAMKLVKAKAAKKPAKQIPWEERRNEVLAKARAKLRETIAAGKAALENVTEASASKPAFKLNPKLPTLDQLADMAWKKAAKYGPYAADDTAVTTTDGYGNNIKWKSRKAAIHCAAVAVLGCDGCEKERYANVLAGLVLGKDTCSEL